METLRSYKINEIDYGQLSRLIECRAKYKDPDSWEGHFSAIIRGLDKSQKELVESAIEISSNLKRGIPPLGQDAPTDIIWLLSILFVFRTLAMLQAKSRDPAISPENQNAHRVILEHYVHIINNLCENKEKFAQPRKG